MTVVDFQSVAYRGGGTSGAGGAIAPPTFGSSIIIHSNSTTNIFGLLKFELVPFFMNQTLAPPIFFTFRRLCIKYIPSIL